MKMIETCVGPRLISPKRGQYKWVEMEAYGWCIRQGVPSYLVASGSGYSRKIGMDLFRALTNPPLRRTRGRGALPRLRRR